VAFYTQPVFTHNMCVNHCRLKIDALVESRNMHNFVIPVKLVLDPDRGTGIQSFYECIKIYMTEKFLYIFYIIL
jgi:hypothetical protein